MLVAKRLERSNEEKKMKKRMIIITTCAAITASMTQVTHASDALFMNDEDRMYLRLCKAVRSNNKLHLHLTLKREGVSYQQMQDGLVCNGQDPITFAMYSGSERVAHVIAENTELDAATTLAKN